MRLNGACGRSGREQPGGPGFAELRKRFTGGQCATAGNALRTSSCAGSVLTRLLVFLVVLLALANIALMAMARRADAAVDSPRTAWIALSNEVAHVERLEQDLMALQDMNAELAGWRKTRVRCSELLEEASRLLPTNVSIHRVSFREGKGAATAKPSPQERPLNVPFRQFRCQIEGRAAGAGALGDVADFAGRLSGSEVFRGVFASVELQGVNSGVPLPADASRKDSFSILAEGRPRPWR
jgi:hypothetical protein